MSQPLPSPHAATAPDRGYPGGLLARARRHRWLLLLAVGSPVLAVLLPVLRPDDGVPGWLGPLTVLTSTVSSLSLVIVYAACATGLGWPLARLLLPPDDTPGAAAGAVSPAGGTGVRWLQPALGLAALLWLTHTFGALGLLSGGGGGATGVALAVLVLGVTLAAVQLVRRVRANRVRRAGLLPPLPPTALLALPAAATIIAAAASPPGYLWESEAGGFDSLSYHLQLPIEWARPQTEGGTGALAPQQHNVYSYLPGSVESLYLHLHALLGGGLDSAGGGPSRLGGSAGTPGSGGGPGGLMAGDGMGLVAAQALHAAMAALAALLVARCASVVLRGWLPVERRTLAGGVAGAALVGTPWVVVVSSLSYNEAGVLAFFAAALLASLEPATRPARRALAVGLLLGAACACKPTAAFLCGPTIAALWALSHRPARWPALALAGAAGVAIAFAPALVRNAAYSGNPVFPAASAALGRAHWSPEQVARFARAHAPPGPLGTGLAALVETSGDPAAPPESDRRSPRGWMHPQWSVLPMVGAACAAGLLLTAATRRAAAALSLGLLAACLWWAWGSHAQSRFLIPLAVPLSVCVGVGFGLLLERARASGAARVAVILLGAVPAVAASTAMVMLLDQRGSRPFHLLTSGVSQVLGKTLRQPLAALPPQDALAELVRLDPATACNLVVPANEELVLLGESAPLYFLGPVRWATNWDAPPPPIGPALDSIDQRPGARALAPDELLAMIRPRQGQPARWFFVNVNELERFHASGWLDPRLSPAFVRTLLDALGQPVLVWRSPRGGGGSRAVTGALYRLAPEPPEAPGTPTPTPPTPSTSPPLPGPTPPHLIADRAGGAIISR